MTAFLPSTQRLDEAAFQATFIAPMREVTQSAEPPLDIWPYVQAVPPSDLHGHEIWYEFVEHVYRTSDGHFDHILVCTKTPNIYLAVIVDRVQSAIAGHHLLDLLQLYGLPGSGAVA